MLHCETTLLQTCPRVWASDDGVMVASSFEPEHAESASAVAIADANAAPERREAAAGPMRSFIAREYSEPARVANLARVSVTGAGRGSRDTIVVGSMPQAAVHPRETLTFAYLCEVLEKTGMLTGEQRREAVAKADVMHARILRLRATGPRKRGHAPGADGVHPVEVLVAMGLGQGGDSRYPLSERVAMQTLAAHVGLPFVDLDPLKIDAKLAPKLLSRPFARRHCALIIEADDRTATVAVADPLNHMLVEDLKTHVRREPRLVIATPTEIQRLITDFYGFRGAVDAAEKQATAGVGSGKLARYVKLKRVDEMEASDSYVIAAVEYLMHYALDQRASDVHIEPRRDVSQVRMRIA